MPSQPTAPCDQAMPADPGHCGRRRALGALGALGLVLALPGRANEQAPAPPVPAAALALINRLPDYQPGGLVSGTVTLWGHGSFKRDFMGPLVQEWMTGLRRHQPGIALDYRMYGTASAISALFTGAGNLALLGEEISPSAALAFQRAKGYAPTAIEVATGSLDVNFFDYAHMIFVHRDNPIRPHAAATGRCFRRGTSPWRQQHPPLGRAGFERRMGQPTDTALRLAG